MRVSTRESLMGRMRASMPSLFAIIGGGLGQCLAFGQQFRAQQVHGQIAVADVEPCWLAELSHCLQAEKCVALHAPSALPAQHARREHR